MNRLQRAVIAVALALSPASCRQIRREQWTADLADARSLGISEWSIVRGALCTALRSPGPAPRPRPATAAGPSTDSTPSAPRRGSRVVAGALILGLAIIAGPGGGATWALHEVKFIHQVFSQPKGSTTVVWGDPDSSIAPEKVDVSNLTITGHAPVTGRDVIIHRPRP